MRKTPEEMKARDDRIVAVTCKIIMWIGLSLLIIGLLGMLLVYGFIYICFVWAFFLTLLS